jgi:CubicO group peptidase (beta-lactamase class C family)
MENPNQTFEQLGQFVRNMMAKTNIPGVAVGILSEGQTFTAGFGITHIEHPLPVTDETLFQIGSITKTFTGTLVMRLVERGDLDLDAPVRRYLPDFKVADEAASVQVTIRHLLTHTAGWAGDFFEDTGSGDDALSKYVANMATLEQIVPPGRIWSYNNASFYLAGYLIEIVTGQSYQTVLKELILDPLGLAHSFLDPTEVMLHRFVVGHTMTETGPKVARPWPLPRAALAAGGVVCHVKDLLRYARFHLGDGTTEDEVRLLKPETLGLMQSTQFVAGNDIGEMGVTWIMDRLDGARYIGHSGGTVGQISLLRLFPKHNFAVAILTNANLGGEITLQLFRWAAEHYLGLDVANPPLLNLSEEKLIPYTGRYTRPFADVEVSLKEGKLLLQILPKQGFPSRNLLPAPPAPPIPCAFYAEDQLIALEGPFKDTRSAFIRNPDGSIGWLRTGGRIHKRLSY